MITIQILQEMQENGGMLITASEAAAFWKTKFKKRVANDRRYYFISSYFMWNIPSTFTPAY